MPRGEPTPMCINIYIYITLPRVAFYYSFCWFLAVSLTEPRITRRDLFVRQRIQDKMRAFNFSKAIRAKYYRLHRAISLSFLLFLYFSFLFIFFFFPDDRKWSSTRSPELTNQDDRDEYRLVRAAARLLPPFCENARGN